MGGGGICSAGAKDRAAETIATAEEEQRSLQNQTMANGDQAPLQWSLQSPPERDSALFQGLLPPANSGEALGRSAQRFSDTAPTDTVSYTIEITPQMATGDALRGNGSHIHHFEIPLQDGRVFRLSILLQKHTNKGVPLEIKSAKIVSPEGTTTLRPSPEGVFYGKKNVTLTAGRDRLILNLVPPEKDKGGGPTFPKGLIVEKLPPTKSTQTLFILSEGNELLRGREKVFLTLTDTSLAEWEQRTPNACQPIHLELTGKIGDWQIETPFNLAGRLDEKGRFIVGETEPLEIYLTRGNERKAFKFYPQNTESGVVIQIPHSPIRALKVEAFYHPEESGRVLLFGHRYSNQELKARAKVATQVHFKTAEGFLFIDKIAGKPQVETYLALQMPAAFIEGHSLKGMLTVKGSPPIAITLTPLGESNWALKYENTGETRQVNFSTNTPDPKPQANLGGWIHRLNEPLQEKTGGFFEVNIISDGEIKKAKIRKQPGIINDPAKVHKRKIYERYELQLDEKRRINFALIRNVYFTRYQLLPITMTSGGFTETLSGRAVDGELLINDRGNVYSIPTPLLASLVKEGNPGNHNIRYTLKKDKGKKAGAIGSEKAGPVEDNTLESEVGKSKKTAATLSPTKMRQVIADLGLASQLLVDDWSRAEQENFIPEGMRLEPKGRKGNIATFEKGPLKIQLIYRATDRAGNLTSNSMLLERATATYQGYGEIPVQVTKFKTGTHALVFGGKWSGVSFYQYGQSNDLHMSEISAHELRTGMVNQFRLPQIFEIGKVIRPSSTAAQRAVGSQIVTNRLHFLIANGVLPKGKPGEKIAEILLQNQSLLERCEALAQVDTLRDRTATLLLKIDKDRAIRTALGKLPKPTLVAGTASFKTSKAKQSAGEILDKIISGEPLSSKTKLAPPPAKNEAVVKAGQAAEDQEARQAAEDQEALKAAEDQKALRAAEEQEALIAAEEATIHAVLDELEQQAIPHSETDAYPVEIKSNGKSKKASFRLINSEIANRNDPVETWVVRETYALYSEEKGEEEDLPTVFEMTRKAFYYDQKTDELLPNHDYSALGAPSAGALASFAPEKPATIFTLSLDEQVFTFPASALTALSRDGKLNDPFPPSFDVKSYIPLKKTEYQTVGMKSDEKEVESAYIRLVSSEIMNREAPIEDQIVQETYLFHLSEKTWVQIKVERKMVNHYRNHHAEGVRLNWNYSSPKEKAVYFEETDNGIITEELHFGIRQFSRNAGEGVQFFIERNGRTIEFARELLANVAGTGNTGNYGIRSTFEPEVTNAGPLDATAKLISDEKIIPREKSDPVKITLIGSDGNETEGEIQLISAKIVDTSKPQNEQEVEEIYRLAVGSDGGNPPTFAHTVELTMKRNAIYSYGEGGGVRPNQHRHAQAIAYQNSAIDSHTPAIRFEKEAPQGKIHTGNFLIQMDGEGGSATIILHSSYFTQLATIGAIPNRSKPIILKGSLSSLHTVKKPESDQEKANRLAEEAARIEIEKLEKRFIPHRETEEHKITVLSENGRRRIATLQLQAAFVDDSSLPLKDWKVREVYALHFVDGEGVPVLFEVSRKAAFLHHRTKDYVVNHHYKAEGAADTYEDQPAELAAGLRANSFKLNVRGGTLIIPTPALIQLSSTGKLDKSIKLTHSGSLPVDLLPIRETKFMPIALDLSGKQTEMREIRLASTTIRSFTTTEGSLKWSIIETYIIRNRTDNTLVEFSVFRNPNGPDPTERDPDLSSSYREGERDKAERTKGIGFDRGPNIIFIEFTNGRKLEIPREILHNLTTQGKTGDYSLKMTIDPKVEKAEQIAKFIQERRMIRSIKDAPVDAKVNLFNGAPLEPVSLQLQSAALVSPLSNDQSNKVEIRETYQMTSREGFTLDFVVTRIATLSLDKPGGEIKITSSYKPGKFYATLTYPDQKTSLMTWFTLTEGASDCVFDIKEGTLLVPTESLAEFSETGALSASAAPIIYANESPLSLEVKQCGGHKVMIELQDPHRVAPFFIPTNVVYDLRSPEGSVGLHRTVAELAGINSATVQAAGQRLTYIPIYSSVDGKAVISLKDTIRIFGEGPLTLHCLYPDIENTHIRGVEAFYNGMLINATLYNVHEVGRPRQIIRQYIIVESPTGDRLLFYRESNVIDYTGFLRRVSSQEEIDRVNRDLEQHYLTREREDREFKEELKKVDELKETDGQAATEKTKAEAINNLAKGNPNKFLSARLLVLHDRFARSPFYHEMVIALAQKYAAIAFTGRTPDLKLSDFIREFYIADSRRTAEEAKLIESGRKEKELKRLDKDVLERFRKLTEMR